MGIASGIIGIAILIFVVPNQFQQLQTANQGVQQTKNQLSEATLNFIDLCMTTQSIADLNGCKQELADIQNRCKDPSYATPACDDPRIPQFFSTVDSRIASYQNSNVATSVGVV